MNAPFTSKPNSDRNTELGISIIELLIVITIISVVTGFALMRITQAQQAMRRVNSAREMIGYLERARLDSIRRHAVATGQMARITVTGPSTYTLLMDIDRDGTLDPPRTIRIPAGQGVFTGAFPKLIMFNWRGKTVNSFNAPAAALPISLTSYGTSSTIDVSGAGSATLDQTVTVSPVVNSTAGTPSFRKEAQIP